MKRPLIRLIEDEQHRLARTKQTLEYARRHYSPEAAYRPLHEILDAAVASKAKWENAMTEGSGKGGLA